MKRLPQVLKVSAVVITALGTMNLANAAVTLNVDDNIKVTAINGQAMNTSLLQNPQQQYTLQAGKHVITAKYDRLYRLQGDNHDYLKSGNITITAQLDDNQTYQLVMPNQPERYQEAVQYAKNPTLAIVQGSQMITSASTQSGGGGIFSSLSSKVGSWFGSDNAVNANTQAIAAINANNQPSQSMSANPQTYDYTPSTTLATTNNNITPIISQAVPNNSSAINNNSGSTLDKFMQIWLQATPAERERIRGWVAK